MAIKKRTVELPVSVIIDGEEVELNTKERLACSKAEINEQLEKQPNEYAFFATVYELMQEELETLKLDLEMGYAFLDAEYRKSLEKDGKKPTEKSIENAIRMDDRYIDIYKKVIEAKRQAGILKALKEAFMKRHDILISLASNYRAEMDVDIWIKKREYEKKGVK